MKDFDFYVRDSSGRPIYFVQHHESHSHNGMCPHEHWIDCREADIESVSKNGNFDQYRQDVRPADWAQLTVE